ncbi:MAG: C40 family peptidase [Mycobacterium sp.]|nr:C40 family peptidase [Mycobacterium sp.]
MGELEILNRAQQLFAGISAPVQLGTETQRSVGDPNSQSMQGAGALSYQRRLAGSEAVLRSASDTDVQIATVLEAAQREHRDAGARSAQLLREARADLVPPDASPMAQREAIRRRAARLRTQHRVVSTAHRRALRRAALLRLLRYAALRRRGGLRLPPASGRAALAVRAALSRLGRPYVWGATGPNQFDCSGLMQWAYHQAGIDLHRTTYDQIHDGVAVPRSQVQPGDLVFPHTGHVQMAIGNGMVVEAPHAGANVQISRLGDVIAIRRPG